MIKQSTYYNKSSFKSKSSSKSSGSASSISTAGSGGDSITSSAWKTNNNFGKWNKNFD